MRSSGAAADGDFGSPPSLSSTGAAAGGGDEEEEEGLGSGFAAAWKGLCGPSSVRLKKAMVIDSRLQYGRTPQS